MKRMWEIKQSAQTPGTLDMFIYGDVQGKYVDYENWTIKESETSANHLRHELAKYPDVTQINVYINSNGGSVFEGTAIYNQLRRHSAHKTVYVDGFACSIASVIAMAGDEVVMPKNALMMVHDMWMGAVGNARELRKLADDLDTINAAGRAAYLQKAGDKLTEEQLVRMMEAETWLTAEQCMEYGFADRYAEKDADMEGAQQMLQQSINSMQQSLAMHKSIAAQLRELAAMPPAPPSPPAELKPKEVPNDKTEPSIMQMLAGLF